MISPRANNRRRFFWIGAVLALIVFGWWLSQPLLSGVRAVALPVGAVLWEGEESAFSWIAVRWEARKERIELAREITALKREREELTTKLSAYNSVVQENRELKEVLSWQAPEEAMLANVRAAPPRLSPYDTVIIDRGETHGALPGQLVYAGDAVIGTISDAALKNSVVSLFSTPGRETAAYIGEDNVPVTLIGRGGGAFVAVAPAEAEILSGDPIHIPDTEPGFVAEVVSIERTPQEPQQLIRARLPINIFTTTRVLVGNK